MLSCFLAAVSGFHAASGPQVTIYTQGFGLVKEVRNVDLKQGRQEIRIADVPSTIDATSVAFRSLANPSGLKVLEQNYRYDLINVASILLKSVGQRIRFIRHFGGKREVLDGVLLAAPTAAIPSSPSGERAQYPGMVVRLDDGRLLLDPVGEVEVARIPQGMMSLPTLVWDVDSTLSGKDRVELSYVAGSMSWNASYVLTLSSVAAIGDLKGWASVTNESGARYQDATLKLLAGDVHQADEVTNDTSDNGLVLDKEVAPPMKEEQLFEYHLYTLQRPATLRDHETKQLSMLESSQVRFSKRLVCDFGNSYPQAYTPSVNVHPMVKVEFINDKQSGLGIPMPAGRFRIYQRDRAGSVQLLGEDSIRHTPKGEKLSLTVGQAFDIVANRKRTAFRKKSPRETIEAFTVEVRNRKATAEVVEVMERHDGDWQVTRSSLPTSEPIVKADANTLEFKLALRPGEFRSVSYTIYSRT